MFEGWNNFFYMIGSAAAGLIGLLFVVMTLTSGGDRARVMRGASLYMTPTALTFAVVLTISAVALAPRLALSAMAALIALAAVVGLAHVGHACIGIHGARTREDPPHWTDFWCYGAAPTLLYLGLAAAAVALATGRSWAVHAIAALLLGLLLIAIRNAWDLVTWMAPMRNSGGGG